MRSTIAGLIGGSQCLEQVLDPMVFWLDLGPVHDLMILPGRALFAGHLPRASTSGASGCHRTSDAVSSGSSSFLWAMLWADSPYRSWSSLNVIQRRVPRRVCFSLFLIERYRVDFVQSSSDRFHDSYSTLSKSFPWLVVRCSTYIWCTF